jgi:5-methylcytosine-specific restriction endonuclease McrA
MIISLRGYSCELCHANDVPLQIHHKHYRRPTGLERPEDLLLLCQNCHRLRHVIRARAIEQERKFHFARKAN